MPTITINNRTFDARPDRIDLRDREYLPRLENLPQQHPSPDQIAEHCPDYAERLILDQGEEGACTGFGLACVINYLLWTQHKPEVTRVSPRMLYQMAKLYDEWPGEDYEGSSCRGAMKGWNKHGVTTEVFWPYRNKQGKVRFLEPKDGWQQDAAQRPLGAYYRINKDSIADMQSAIFEVGAIYVSAKVTKEWFLDASRTLPIIKFSDEVIGGHAFAVVGYSEDGFVLQNSWGNGWGFHGFAVLPYNQWVRYGSDAWVATLGAPMTVTEVSRSRVSAGWEKSASLRTHILPPSDSYRHAVVLGNDGIPLNRFLDLASPEKALEEVCCKNPESWMGKTGNKKLAIYAHGGLNDEENAMKRVSVMAPYFLENDIYPVFFIWKTGLLESIGDCIEDAAERFFRAEGIISNLMEQMAEVRDRSIEVAAEHILVKSLWDQMKQNACAAQDNALKTAEKHLKKLDDSVPGLEMHMVGHSAGSILLGYLLSILRRKRWKIRSCTLYAPACTIPFANQHFGGAFPETISQEDFHVDLLSDERERADSVTAYGKSLLYLVSRALEEAHKTPLLGMEGGWTDRDIPSDIWNQDYVADVQKWRKKAEGVQLGVHTIDRAMVSTGPSRIPLAHGSFDNDIEVITETLKRIRGKNLKVPVTNLDGY